MPMYTVSSRTALSSIEKQNLATCITDVHCQLTGAPRTFVNVVFSQGVPLKKGINFNVFGNVRKGRTPKMNDVLIQELTDKICDCLTVLNHELELTLFEVPASWVMEGGEVLPEPGEEDKCDWLAT